jgi:hypothetical protein
MPDDATPNGDQPEGGDASGGLYDLASVPEDLRPHVEPHLKAIEANITKKLQENSESLKRWEPYEELGVADIDPQALQQLLEFAELAQDEDKFAEWFKQTGERLGLMEDPADDLDLDLDDELTPEKIEQLIAKAVSENIEPVKQGLQEREAKEAEQAAISEITETLNELRSEHGEDLDTDAVLQLAYAYADEDPDNAITRGFEDYQRLVGKGEAGLFAKKVGQPEAPEGPGRASNAPEKLTTGNPTETARNVRAAALDRLKADRAAAA